MPRKKAIIMTSINTTTVDPKACFRVGHVTFFSSTRTSLRNCIPFRMKPNPDTGLTGVLEYCREVSDAPPENNEGFLSETVFLGGINGFESVLCFFFFLLPELFFFCSRATLTPKTVKTQC